MSDASAILHQTEPKLGAPLPRASLRQPSDAPQAPRKELCKPEGHGITPQTTPGGSCTRRYNHCGIQGAALISAPHPAPATLTPPRAPRKNPGRSQEHHQPSAKRETPPNPQPRPVRVETPAFPRGFCADPVSPRKGTLHGLQQSPAMPTRLRRRTGGSATHLGTTLRSHTARNSPGAPRTPNASSRMATGGTKDLSWLITDIFCRLLFCPRYNTTPECPRL